MGINVWTKEIAEDGIDFSKVDLCKIDGINQTVKDLYYQHQENANRFLYAGSLPEHTPEKKRYYVYIWRTTDGKVFYVGKGANKRYEHILTDIEKYNNGDNNPRFEQYAMLQKDFGIEHEIVLGQLSEYESLIYEECLKLDMISRGEVLLNVEGIPYEYLPVGWGRTRAAEPELENSPFYSRYYNLEPPVFDAFDYKAAMKCYINNYGIATEAYDSVEKKYTIIDNWIKTEGGKSYKRPSTRTQSVIVMGFLSTETYLSYKRKDFKVFNANDVIAYINNTCTDQSLHALSQIQYTGEETQRINRTVYLEEQLREILCGCGAQTEYLDFENGSATYRNVYCFSYFIFKKKEQYRISIPNDRIDPEEDKWFEHTSNWQGHFLFSDINEIRQVIKSLILSIKYAVIKSQNNIAGSVDFALYDVIENQQSRYDIANRFVMLGMNTDALVFILKEKTMEEIQRQLEGGTDDRRSWASFLLNIPLPEIWEVIEKMNFKPIAEEIAKTIKEQLGDVAIPPNAGKRDDDFLQTEDSGYKSSEVAYYCNLISHTEGNDKETWKRIKAEVYKWFISATPEEQEEFTNSGYGEMLAMLCSALGIDE